MADQLPGVITVPTRDVTMARHIRDRLLRTPNARSDQGSQVWVDANTIADTVNPLFAIAVKNGQTMSLDDISGTDLEDIAEDAGIPRRLPPVGASGFVICQAGASGGTIFAGDLIGPVNAATPTWYCTVTKFYANGDNVPVTGKDTGPQTDIAAGAVLQWKTQRPGIGQIAAVFAQQDGTGLSGGSVQETDDGIRVRIRYRRANPPASGNDAEYQEAIEATPGIPIEKAFTYPSILAPSSIGYVVTVRPPSLGGSRIPNGTEIAQTLAWVAPQMPASDAIFDSILQSAPLDVALQVSWSPNAVGWAGANPWPLSSVSDPVRVTPDANPTATTFVLDCLGQLTGGGSQAAPAAGMQLAFYDAVNLVSVPDPSDPTGATSIQSPTFRLKTILTATVFPGLAWVAHAVAQADTMIVVAGLFYISLNAGVTGSGPTWPTSTGITVIDGGVTWICIGSTSPRYSIVCDTSNGSTDTTNTPVIEQPCCPWSTSLNALIAPACSQFDTLGPGEQASAIQLFDDGLRMRRSPRSPQFWPSELTHKFLGPLYALSTIEDVSVLSPTLPYQTPTGTLGVSSWLLQLRYLTAFPE